MKRSLIENHKVLLGQGAVDREGFLSAVYALKVPGELAEGTAIDILIEHGETEGGDFEAVPDPEVFPTLHVGEKEGTLEGIAVSQGEDINVDIDLLGCRRFIRVTPSFRDGDGAEVQAEYMSAVVLGDGSRVPV